MTPPTITPCAQCAALADGCGEMSRDYYHMVALYESAMNWFTPEQWAEFEASPTFVELEAKHAQERLNPGDVPEGRDRSGVSDEKYRALVRRWIDSPTGEWPPQ